MSKKGYFSRYLLIIKKLKVKKYTSFEDLQHYIANQLNYLQMRDDTLDIGFSKRTLQRDLKEIRNLFGVDIEHSKQHKGYYIVHDENDNMNFQRMVEAFDTFSSLNMAQDLKPFIHLEKQRPQGTESMYGLLHAIKNLLRIKFDYHKFWEEKPNERIVEPYALKEFKNRWYLIAKDCKSANVRIFALDRLSNLSILTLKFTYPLNYSVAKMFNNCFGIIAPDNEPVEEVVLSFTPFQGKYIKTLPLHHTQQILIDNEEECKISLMVNLTFDLEQEILSHGANVKVVLPERLRFNVKEALLSAVSQYQ
ncbi:MAG: WYL domain-containing protein [Pedobacter sp.]|uniref:helix-turn-helix transcriptional regulator n=1 Tax=Pedobacter sp. TaxID=1411316 RepID=UPI002806A5B7|nr:WYL domain-containing protein [Pedobacter sp.]MDQ8004814.1 WYL domain-containing protein [Pedobacter sp.]